MFSWQGCDSPFSYLTKTVPPKNTNLYWHFGVNYNKNYHNFSENDETNIFIICTKNAKIDFPENKFYLIDHSNNFNLLLKK